MGSGGQLRRGCWVACWMDAAGHVHQGGMCSAAAAGMGAWTHVQHVLRIQRSWCMVLDSCEQGGHPPSPPPPPSTFRAAP